MIGQRPDIEKIFRVFSALEKYARELAARMGAIFRSVFNRLNRRPALPRVAIPREGPQKGKGRRLKACNGQYKPAYG